VGVGREESVSVDSVRVWVSNVPVLDGSTSVNVGSSVCVGVGGELTSEGVESGGVDSVGVSVKKVELERCGRCLVKNGGTPPVKLKGEKAGEAVSDDSGSSSLMERVDGPQG
jgi:hypothetical protein